MHSRKEVLKIWAITLVFSFLFLVGYSYFIAVPIQRVSRDAALGVCAMFHLNCDPSKLINPHPEENQ